MSLSFNAKQVFSDGLITFPRKFLNIKLSNYFSVRVGFVAKNKIAATENNVSTLDAVSSSGVISYGLHSDWIRPPTHIKASVFCRCKTRHAPFFITDEPMQFDGSVLGLFPTKNCPYNNKALVAWLNGIDWLDYGAKSPDGRYQFSQGILTKVIL